MCSKFFDKLGNSEKLKNILINLGSNNKATYAAIAIAVTKGIFRPLATMMDTKEDINTRKYTACREALTEVIAVPSYWVCGELAAKMAEKFQKNPEKLKITKANLGFLGVCFATLIAIPGLCSLLIKPITNKIFNKKDEKKQQEQPQKLDIVDKPANDVKFNGNNIYPKTNNILPINKNNIFTSMNSTMRVG